VVASGDLPNYYYTIELPEWISEWFCLPLVKTEELKAHLISQGDQEAANHLGSEEHLGVAVPLMGWNWAVFLAELVLGDMVTAKANPSGEMWDSKWRLIEGGMLEQMTLEKPLNYTYIDDFGALGITEKGNELPGAIPAKFMKETTTTHIRNQGRQVHKEVLDEKETILGITVGGSPPMVQPPEAKLWEMMEILWALSRRKKVKPGWVETAVATFNWMALIVRLTLSIFESVYYRIAENRESVMEI